MIENVLESKHSIFWVEHFANGLIEDLTLHSQMDEFMALQDRMADACLDMRFFAIFENSLKKELTSHMQGSGKNDGRRTEQWEIFLDLVKDGESGTFSQKQSNEATDSDLELSAAGLDPQARFSNSRPSSKDQSATMSRVMDLLHGQTSLPIGHQIEMLLRLQSFLRKTRVLIDPLKVLFQLILRKASNISVYVLLAIGQFYHELEKFHEALEVYTAASKKIDHLDVPLKFTIHQKMGHCYCALGLDIEALRSYEEAFSGREILLGKRHKNTMKSLYRMSRIYDKLGQSTEVLRLCDKICMGQDFVPQLCIEDNVYIQVRKYSAYCDVGDDDKATLMKKSLQVTLTRYSESLNKENGISPYFLYVNGYANHRLGENETALEFFQLALEAYKKANGLNHLSTLNTQYWIGRTYHDLERYDTALESFQLALEAYKKLYGLNHSQTLNTQYCIGCTYNHLGRYYDAKELLEMMYAEQQRILGPDHRNTQWTINALNDLVRR